MRGICCIIPSKASAPVGTIPPGLPSVLVDPATGIPMPGFAWWHYFPYYPAGRPITTTITPTTTAADKCDDDNDRPKNPQLNPNLFEGDILGISPHEDVSISTFISIPYSLFYTLI